MSGKLTKLIYNSWLELAARWSLGIIFVYACYHKIVEPAQFAKIIYGYYFLPDVSINIIAIVLPFLELFAGFAMIFGVYPRSAAAIINGMILAFIIALSVNLIRGQQFDCGCFSFDEAGYTYSAGQLLIRDIICFVLGMQVIFFDRHRRWCIRQTGSILKNV